MKAISFGWTTGAFVTGRKTVTRRLWKARYAARFHKGEEVLALDKDYRYGGKPIGTIQLTQDPYQERIDAIPFADLAAEGGYWSTVGEWLETWTEKGHAPSSLLWVIRFRILELTERGRQLEKTYR